VALDHIQHVARKWGLQRPDQYAKDRNTARCQENHEGKAVILMAWGEKKSNIIRASVEGKVSSQVPASYLQEHITGWLGGKSNADVSKRLERPEPVSKRVLILSLYPEMI
jgi:glucosamine-6-phosphate deaminase